MTAVGVVFVGGQVALAGTAAAQAVTDPHSSEATWLMLAAFVLQFATSEYREWRKRRWQKQDEKLSRDLAEQQRRHDEEARRGREQIVKEIQSNTELTQKTAEKVGAVPPADPPMQVHT